jgi:hypothetical protein
VKELTLIFTVTAASLEVGARYSARVRQTINKSAISLRSGAALLLDLCRQERRFFAETVRLTFKRVISIAKAREDLLTPWLKWVVAWASLKADFAR